MTSPRNRSRRAFRWCVAALLGCAATGVLAVTLAQKAREEGCTDKPVRLSGSDMYKCTAKSGNMSYFNVPDGTAESAPAAKPSPAARPATSPSPASFPKIDAGTQKSRDDLRRKVLQDDARFRRRPGERLRRVAHDVEPTHTSSADQRAGRPPFG